jgi:hypothetical protein
MLLDVVADAHTGTGAVVLVAGPSGIGQVVHDKAETLTDPAHKQSFLERVPLSREILSSPA